MTERGGTQTARVFVPEKKLATFLRLVDAYASSIVLTYLAEPANEDKLKALQDEDEDFRFWGPVYKTREGKCKLRFVVPEASAAEIHRPRRQAGHPAIVEPQESEADRQRHDDPPRPHRGLLAGHAALSPLDEEIWWEIWLRGSRQDANEVFHRFVDIAAIVGIDRVSDRYVSFPERLVLHAYASADRLSSSVDLLAMIAELRKAKELATPYVTMPARPARISLMTRPAHRPAGEERPERLHPRRRGQPAASAARARPRRPRTCRPSRRIGGPRTTHQRAARHGHGRDRPLWLPHGTDDDAPGRWSCGIASSP